MLDIELSVEQPPPQRHGLAGEIGVDLIDRSIDLDPGVDADLAPLGALVHG